MNVIKKMELSYIVLVEWKDDKSRDIIRKSIRWSCGCMYVNLYIFQFHQIYGCDLNIKILEALKKIWIFLIC